MERCFFVLRDWQTNKKSIKYKLSEHLGYKQECTMEYAFENIVKYTRYAKKKKEHKARADTFMQNSLFSKAI